MNARIFGLLALAAVSVAATSCTRMNHRQYVNHQPKDEIAAPRVSGATRLDPAMAESRRKTISGEHSSGDAAYLAYYRSTCHIDADTPPDSATLTCLQRRSRELTPEQAARVAEYRATCNIR